MISPERIRRTRDRALLAVAARNSLSQWTATRPGPVVIDPVTGDSTPSTIPVWSGDAHFFDQSRPHVKPRADTAIVVSGPTLCVQAGTAPRFLFGDTVTMTDGDDASLLGRAWMISGSPDASSYGIHHHYPLEEAIAVGGPS